MVDRVEVDALPAALADQRIDRIVAIVADVTRSKAQALIDDGRVTIDGTPVAKGSLRVGEGAAVTVEVDPTDDRIQPDPSFPVDVVHADAAVIVVDKRAGQVVHPGAGVASTLVNGLLARFPELAEVGETHRPGIVHRLDRGTSGLLVVARTPAAHRELTAQLAARSVDRRYRTLVLGTVDAEAGVIDAPLGRSPNDATRRAVVADGRPARTHYEVVTRFTTAGGSELRTTLLTCRLETGRTHQIRAHLAAIGHPVVGDVTYGGSVDGTQLERLARRPFLHAELLGFDHPDHGRHVEYTSPLPADLTALAAHLGRTGDGGGAGRGDGGGPAG